MAAAIWNVAFTAMTPIAFGTMWRMMTRRLVTAGAQRDGSEATTEATATCSPADGSAMRLREPEENDAPGTLPELARINVRP